MLSKFLGFGREILVANLFGTSWRLDAVFVAITPATTLTRIVSAGIIAIFFPIYHELKLKDAEKAKEYAGSILKLYSLIFIILGILFLAIPDFIIRIFAPGFSAEIVSYAARKLQYLAILPLAIGFENLLGAFLRAERNFFEYGFVQIIFNLVAIPVIYIGSAYFSEASYVLATVFGNLSVMFLSLFFSRKLFNLKGKLFLPETAQTFKLAFPFMFSASLSSINIIVDKMFVSTLPSGRVSSLQYSSTLLGIVTTIISVFTLTSYTELSEKVTAKDLEGASERMRKTVKSSLNFSIPLTAWVVIMAEALVRVVFQHGEFSAESTNLVSTALIGYSALLVVTPISTVATNFLTASKKAMWVLYIVPVSITANALFDWLFIIPFSHSGVALSTSIVAIITLMIRLRIVKKKHSISFVPIKRLITVLGIVIPVSIGVYFLKNIMSPIPWLILGNFVFIALLLVIANDEIKAVFGKFLKIRRKV